MHRLTELTLDYPKTAAALLLLATIGLGLGLPRVPVVHGSRVLVGAQHPAVQTLDGVVNTFSSGLPLEIGWECGEGLACEHALDERSLAVSADLTRRISRMADVRVVRSPSNSSILIPIDEGMRVRRFVENGELRADHASLVEHVVADSLWTGRLVSSDLTAAAIIVQPTDNSTATGERLIDRFAPLFAPHEANGFEFRLNGMAVRAIVSGRELQASTARIIPALVAVIGIVLYVLAGSAIQVAISLATMGVGLLWTRGMMGWLQWPQDGIHQVLAPLVMIVGVCDAVHLLSRAAEATGSSRERIIEAAKDVALPCFITTATTAVALASFATSNLFSFVRFGLISAFGVCACFVLTFTLLPLLATATSGFDGRAAERTDAWDGALDRFLRFAQERSVAILTVGALLLGFGGYGWATHLRVDTDWVRAFGEDSTVSTWIRFFDERRGKSDSVEIQLTLPDGLTFEHPETLAVIEQLSAALEEIPDLRDPSSVLDLLDRLQTILIADPNRTLRYAPTRAGNAELLELIAFDDPESISPWLTLDRRTTVCRSAGACSRSPKRRK